MAKDFQDIYKRVINALVVHNKFLHSTEKNLSYYIFGKDVPLVKTLTFPQIDLVQTLRSYKPKAYNPLAYFVNSFIDEIANSGFVVDVNPYPVKGKEPYEAFANQLEDYLIESHRLSERRKNLWASIFEILIHGYFGLYTDGRRSWYLTAYDVFPGDSKIPRWQNQPFIVRRTIVSKAGLKKAYPKIDLSRSDLSSVSLLSDLESIVLYDTWVKDLDLNVCFTGAGTPVYHQSFPYPKIYPFFGAFDTKLLNSFYTMPVINILRVLLLKDQKGLENIEESSKSIANPILTYDADAGIDVNALQRALKEGYKRIIIGKNREGNIEFHAPGHLPNYALEFPDRVEDQMMKHLGLTQSFLGNPTKSVRERGAMGRLIKTAFRRLSTITGSIEGAFTDLDNYLIRYAQAHQMKMKESETLKNIEEIFQDRVRYIAEEKFKGFGSEDTLEAKNFAMLKWKSRLVGQETALRELGHHQPQRIIKQMRTELKESQEFARAVKAESGLKPESLLDKIANRLKGQLQYRFYLVPVSDDKVLVRCQEDEEKLVGFLLSDLSSSVLIEGIKKKVPRPADQASPAVTAREAPSSEAPSKIEEPPVIEKPPVEETRGRPRTKPLPPEEETKSALKKIIKKEEVPKEERTKSPPFSEERLKNLIARKHTIRRPERFYELPGLYLTEPHARWIAEGKKLLILKSRKFDIVDKPYLLCGHKVYGIIIVRDILENFDVEATRKYHLVSAGQQKKWWKGKKLYLYMFEFHPFPEPLEYNLPQGVQTFMNKVPIKAKEMGIPQEGDLKVTSYKPWKVPVPHKPEKKAFQPQEVFSLKRLQEIIPEATYDVSEKIDGLRCFSWIHKGEARMFSDVGSRFAENRIKPLLEALPKVFKHDALVDGELVMEGIRRKDIAGYVHGKWKPTPEQLKSLRYVCWDILYVKDKSIAIKPFSTRSAVLDLYLKKGCKGPICRVRHSVVKRPGVAAAVKKLTSAEGAVIRDINASYFATHSTYKMKYMFDVDAKVFAVAKTKVGLPIFFCELRDGTYIGSTYAQSEIKAKPGDVIRVNVDHVSIRPNGTINWYAPKPKSFKEGKIVPKRISTTQVGIGGPDTIDLAKEIYLATGGSRERWDAWWPKYQTWKKEKMADYKKRIQEKIKAGVPVAKIA